MSDFADVWAKRQGHLDARFGEAFVLVPRARVDGGDVNARTLAVTADQNVPFTGIFTAEGEEEHAHARHRPDRTIRPVEALPPTIDAALAQFPTRPATDSQVIRQKTGEQFRIAAVRDSDVEGRIDLRLVRFR